MKRHRSYLPFVARWTGIPVILLLAMLFGVYFFVASAQTEQYGVFKGGLTYTDPLLQVDGVASVNALTNGRLAFNHLVAGPGADRNVEITLADGSSVGGLPTGTTWPQDPTWSPDGTKLAYSSTVVGITDIWTVNENGSGGVNLTNTSDIFEDHASWSAMGKIAYERQGAIWTMNTDGTGQAMFVAGARPAWSPDGSKLAYSSGGNIWYINANGAGATQVTNGSGNSEPTWSPDGSKIAFSRSNVIRIINVDGTNEISLPGSGTEPAWSPDGIKIAFSGPSGLWVMDADGTNQVRIRTDVINYPLCCDHHYRNPAWQPVAQTPNTFIISGRITDNNGAGVGGATVNLSGSLNAATTTDQVGNYSFSGLTPGGSYTVSPSMLARRFLPPNHTFNNLDGSRVRNFTASRVCIGLLCAQNGKIAFTRSGEIWTMNPDGSGQTNITNNAASDSGADWAPDGVRMAFSSNRDGNFEIYLKAAEDDLNPTRLTNDPASDSSPRFSPSGASIVFTSTRDGNGEIYKMNADGSNQVRLTNDAAHDTSSSFSPDGSKILWLRQAASAFSLYTMNADGSNQQLLFGPANFATTPSYSPDGTKILLVYGVDVTQQTIYVMNADGTGLAQSGLGRSQPAWSADGTKIIHNCCFFQGPQMANGLFVSNLGGPLGQRLTSDGNNESSPDWQPIPVQRRTAFDYDGDGRSDISFFRPTGGFWYQARSSGGVVAPQWGLANDVLAPADYDGDLKTDIAVWRESDATFYALNSFDMTVRIEQFGIAGDVPTGGDFDGDGKADVAVYRAGPQSFFYYRASMGNPQRNITFVPWGTNGDKPVVGDFDGDARTDVGVFRPSANTWYVRKSADAQLLAAYFGAATDTLVPADYDGDGKTDIAVFRSGTWYLLRSALGFATIQWGTNKDIPAPADYDGDGHADLTIYRQGTWWILKSASGAAESHPFGTATDKPIPAAYVR